MGEEEISGRFSALIEAESINKEMKTNYDSKNHNLIEKEQYLEKYQVQLIEKEEAFNLKFNELNQVENQQSLLDKEIDQKEEEMKEREIHLKRKEIDCQRRE